MEILLALGILYLLYKYITRRTGENDVNVRQLISQLSSMHSSLSDSYSNMSFEDAEGMLTSIATDTLALLPEAIGSIVFTVTASDKSDVVRVIRSNSGSVYTLTTLKNHIEWLENQLEN